MEKNDIDLSSWREQRRARENSRVRGRGAVKDGVARGFI
jgi:hypothetical protein